MLQVHQEDLEGAEIERDVFDTRRFVMGGTFIFKIVTLVLFLLVAFKIGYEVFLLTVSVEDNISPDDRKEELSRTIEKVHVDVYYEALCPDSKHFINRQLKPTYSKIGEYIEISYVPYGKATTKQNGTSWSFDCQHGPLECQGNKLHACGAKYIKNTSEQLNFVSCLITNGWKPEEYAEKCSGQVSGPWEQIRDCSRSAEGSELHKLYGEMTSKLQPSVSFIPTILLNQVFVDQRDVLKNLLGSVCSILKRQGASPEECR